MSIIAKLVSDIKNGFLTKKLKIVQQYSKKSINILNILLREGFIKNYIINKETIIIYLKYKKNKSVINDIKYIAKKKKIVNIKKNSIYKKKKKFIILSTTLGLLTIVEAKKYNIGGKVICEVS